MLKYETVEEMALQKVGAKDVYDMTLTQRTIFNILREFGLEVAKKADAQFNKVRYFATNAGHAPCRNGGMDITGTTPKPILVSMLRLLKSALRFPLRLSRCETNSLQPKSRRLFDGNSSPFVPN